MNILFFTKSKPYTCEILNRFYEQGHTVIVVCKDMESFRETTMQAMCGEMGIHVYDNQSIYRAIDKKTLPQCDLAISNTYGRLIKKPIIDFVDGRIFNVHCAPLPAYRGMFAYNWAIFNEEKSWAVTAHYVNEQFDEGEIIKATNFAIDPQMITVTELERESQKVGLELTLEVIRMFEKEKKPAGKKQEGAARYYSREDFEWLKRVTSRDSASVIHRKIRACWCPPYEGAYYECDGARFPLQYK